ncbi:MAG TPA: glycosyltransferase, partial [Methylomirabilota bacterium]|nr:glycosyltransferase [Methylomirabilota bacterium]
MSGTRVAVIIASYGRPAELAQLLQRLAVQSLQPVQVVLAVCDRNDAPRDLPVGLDVEIVVAKQGLSAQRNAGLRAVGPCDYVAFFDDDYVPSRRAIEGIVGGFGAFPDLAGLNGWLLADGINGPGISHAEAVRKVEEFDAAWTPRPPSHRSRDLIGLYGCNMAFRWTAIDGSEFDEKLPLYAWQEDVDFASRIRKAGGMARTDAFHGVHRGVKNGRTSGYRFGYSQVVNPLY